MRLTTVWGPVARWGEYRRTQRSALEASGHIRHPGPGGEDPAADAEAGRPTPSCATARPGSR